MQQLVGLRHATGEYFLFDKQDSDSIHKHTEINLVLVIADCVYLSWQAVIVILKGWRLSKLISCPGPLGGTCCVNECDFVAVSKVSLIS